MYLTILLRYIIKTKICKHGHVRQAKGGGGGIEVSKPWYPHPTLETNKTKIDHFDTKGKNDKK